MHRGNGRIIADFREEYGLTFRELAALIHVSQTILQQWDGWERRKRYGIAPPAYLPLLLEAVAHRRRRDTRQARRNRARIEQRRAAREARERGEIVSPFPRLPDS